MEKWEEIKAKFEAAGTVTIQGKEIGDNGRVEDMLRYVPFPESFAGERVLDVGTGGSWWAYLAEERGAEEVVAIDSNPTMLRIAEANRPEGSKVQLLQRDVMALRPGKAPFDRPFDTVLAMAVLHYCERPDTALERIKSMLRPGGRVLIESYVKESPKPGPEIYKWQPTPQLLSQTVLRHFGRLSNVSFRPGGAGGLMAERAREVKGENKGAETLAPNYGRAALWAYYEPGVFFFLTGASGAGKTYLAEMIAERFQDARVIRPDVEMGLTEPGADQPWGYDYDKFFQDVLPPAFREHRVVVLEAVMPSSQARRRLLQLVPADWFKAALVLDQTPEELRDFCPYFEHGLWQERYALFQVNAPHHRRESEPWDMVLHISPLQLRVFFRTFGGIVREVTSWKQREL